MLAAEKVIHLAWLDHCPNVVVEGRRAGCQIVCSSSGGTREIAGADAIVIEEDEWNMDPVRLYDPPEMDFSRVISNKGYDWSCDISETCDRYLELIEKVKR